ncbi:MAG: RDD family protein [Gammaproteobacteria bacterium]|nr:RDD family protein [Gammaproteobacteria bacterium]
MLDTVREVSTPELVALHLRLAGPVARALAWLIDFLLRFGIFAATGGVLAAFGKFGWGMFVIIIFALEWFYPVLFEVLGNGATPGKRALGLAVCNDDGTPIRWGPSFTRNLLRTVDFLPVAYGIGLLAMFTSSEFRRVGDVLAGTVVVYRSTSRSTTLPAVAPLAPSTRLSRDAQRAVLAFAERAPKLTSARAEEIAALAPQLTDQASGAESVQRLLGLANYIVGRRA